MDRVRLVFGGLSEIVGCHGLAVILLTNQEKTRAISIVCDKAMKYQIGLRTAMLKLNARLLPEVLVSILGDVTDLQRYEVYIYNLVDGEYKAIIRDPASLREYPVRLSDAIMLSLISGMAIFMETTLFYTQSMPYKAETDKLSIPINTLSTENLAIELKKAVDGENYRLASLIQEELKKRK